MINVRVHRGAMRRILSLVSIIMVTTVSGPPAAAQVDPMVGTDCTIVYVPPPDIRFAPDAPLEVYYVFNYWGTRSGTRLALLENVRTPDTSRVRRLALERVGDAWRTVLPIPEGAAVLSYYVTDGVTIDDNRERTYVARVKGVDGRPVRNAHYFMTPFLQLAREPLAARVREAEQEILLYPDNFRTYSQYFSLAFEQAKGSGLEVQRIIERLDKLEAQYAEKEDYLNLAARTYYYLLRDVETAMNYKNRIPVTAQWPEVIAIYNREEVMEERRQKASARAATRDAIRNSLVPDVTFVDFTGGKHPLRGEGGRVTVVLFWATTSEMSRKLITPLVRLHDALHEQGVRVVAVNLDLDIERAKGFLERTRMPFEHRRNNGSALIALGVDAIPHVMVLDERRTVRQIFTGYTDGLGDEIDRAVRGLL